MLITFKHSYYNITGFIQKFFIILTNVNIMSEKQVLLNFSHVYILRQLMKNESDWTICHPSKEHEQPFNKNRDMAICLKPPTVPYLV